MGNYLIDVENCTILLGNITTELNIRLPKN